MKVVSFRNLHAYRFVKDRQKMLTYDVYMDHRKLESMAFKAAAASDGKYSEGPVEVVVTKHELKEPDNKPKGKRISLKNVLRNNGK